MNFVQMAALALILAAVAYFLAPAFELSPTYWQCLLAIGFAKVVAVYLGNDTDVSITLLDERER